MITPQGGSIAAPLIIKRASANDLDVAYADKSIALLYTTTPITVTKIMAYSANDVTTGILDVGIDGDADALVAAESVTATRDTVTELTITGSPNVAAGHMVTASVPTAGEGHNGIVAIAIEYHETE